MSGAVWTVCLIGEFAWTWICQKCCDILKLFLWATKNNWHHIPTQLYLCLCNWNKSYTKQCFCCPTSNEFWYFPVSCKKKNKIITLKIGWNSANMSQLQFERLFWRSVSQYSSEEKIPCFFPQVLYFIYLSTNSKLSQKLSKIKKLTFWVWLPRLETLLSCCFKKKKSFLSSIPSWEDRVKRLDL